MSAALAEPCATPVIRPAAAADLPFILNSWLRSYEATATAAGVPRGRYYSEHHARISRVLERGRCLLAVNPEAPAVILGYVAFEERAGQILVHYLYVKHVARRMGLGRFLLEQAGAMGCRYTHHTRAGAHLAEAFRARYAPESLEG